MIGRLTGALLEVVDNVALLSVGGVGYEVEVADGARLLEDAHAAGPGLADGASPPDPNAQVTLHTHLVVREDAQLLYGFSVRTERDLFRNLIRINGVGPKMALAILGTYSSVELARRVRDDDAKALTRVPGVGKKTAERLLVELKNRADLLPEDTAEVTVLSPRDNQAAVCDEVEQALVALGYKPQYASQVVQHLASDPDISQNTQTMLRAALQYLAQKTEVRS